MNETTLLRDFGPDAPLATELVLARSRAELIAELTAPEPRRRPGRGRVIRLRPRVTLRAAALVAAAACVLTAVLVAQSGGKRGGVGNRVTLLAYTTPQFPLSLQPIPVGLSAPAFSMGEGGSQMLAAYRDPQAPSTVQGSDVDVAVDTHQPPPNGPASELRQVTFDGVPAELAIHDKPATSPKEVPTRIVSLTWQRHPEQWVTVIGNARFATEDSVRALAASLVDVAQQLPMQLRLAPQGWVLDSVKGDSIVTLRDTTAAEPDRTLSVQLLDQPDPNFARDVGAESVSTVQVNGRPAQLVTVGGIRILETTLPDGSAFRLQTPADLTSQQVVQLAAGVSHT